MAKHEDDSFSEQILKAGLVLLFCALMGAALLQAAYRILSPWELRAYWKGEWGFLPGWPIAASVHIFGKSAIAFRAPMLLLFAFLLGLILWLVYHTLRGRLQVGAVLAVLGACLMGLAMQQSISIRKVRTERHEFIAVQKYLARCAAPNESVILDDVALERQLNWYAMDTYLSVPPDSLLLQKGNLFPENEPEYESVFVGDGHRAIVTGLIPSGFRLARDVSIPEAIEAGLQEVSGDHEAAVYFVTRDAPAEGGAVSSNP